MWHAKEDSNSRGRSSQRVGLPPHQNDIIGGHRIVQATIPNGNLKTSSKNFATTLEQRQVDNHFNSQHYFRLCRELILGAEAITRKSFSYNKVPQEPLKLTVLKLDGTYFDIEVAKNGTVAELKQAVEVAFSHLPQSGPGKVSWSHVWDHFCLSYNGYKLLNDNDFIGCYEIKDDDQLQFIRHVSINYMERTRAKRDGLILDKRNLRQTLSPNRLTDHHPYFVSRIKGEEVLNGGTSRLGIQGFDSRAWSRNHFFNSNLLHQCVPRPRLA
ncbi:hypothetical protein Leryth_010914 [Lithospermum erythrorhizon]|nr:hypothetical protein Leryth_010914 [Lithospermum erythrorhizon]